jgi:regulatory protein
LPQLPKAPATPAKPKQTLRARAVALLARREYSRSELRSKLAQDRGGADGAPRGSSADLAEVDAVLDELAARGYLSDARFAQQFARQKSGAFSKRAIGASLKARGVEGEAATEALAGVEIDDEQAMIALWRRRFGAPPANEKEKARQVRFLQSRGFSLSAIIKLLRNPPTDEPSQGA